jgi:hypothetical protein
MTIIQWNIDNNVLRDLLTTSTLIDDHKRLKIEYNNRPIRDANSKNIFYAILWNLFVPFLCTTAWSTMTESVGNETIETYWCFSSRNWHWPNVITWHDLKKKGSVGYVYATKKNKPLMVNFKFAKLHCYQQIQSFLVMPYFPH